LIGKTNLLKAKIPKPENTEDSTLTSTAGKPNISSSSASTSENSTLPQTLVRIPVEMDALDELRGEMEKVGLGSS
jgi:hypothetical protein